LKGGDKSTKGLLSHSQEPDVFPLERCNSHLGVSESVIGVVGVAGGVAGMDGVVALVVVVLL